MIGLIRGIILEKQAPQLLIEAHGVGYEIDAPMSTFYHLPEIGEVVCLFTHFVVREDAQHLFGFYTKDERVLFRSLLKVNGVGPKLALTILSSLTIEEFIHCVINNDMTRLTSVPGIGKKTAERLIIEMRDKLSNAYQFSPVSLPDSPTTNRYSLLQDAIAALISLGYKPPEANRVITKIDDGLATSEDLIRQALKEMM